MHCPKKTGQRHGPAKDCLAVFGKPKTRMRMNTVVLGYRIPLAKVQHGLRQSDPKN